MRALKKGVKIRILTDQDGNGINPEYSAVLQSLIVNSNYRVKSASIGLKGQFVIFDKKEIYISHFSTGNFGEHPHLWTDNKNLLDIVGDYFEKTWISRSLKFRGKQFEETLAQ
jgi:hypothetical protein